MQDEEGKNVTLFRFILASSPKRSRVSNQAKQEYNLFWLLLRRPLQHAISAPDFPLVKVSTELYDVGCTGVSSCLGERIEAPLGERTPNPGSQKKEIKRSAWVCLVRRRME